MSTTAQADTTILKLLADLRSTKTMTNLSPDEQQDLLTRISDILGCIRPHFGHASPETQEQVRQAAAGMELHHPWLHRQHIPPARPDSHHYAAV